MTVSLVVEASARIIDVPELCSTNQGPVAARKDPATAGTGGPVPEGAIYPVRLLPVSGGGRALRRVRGAVVIRDERASLVARIYRQLVGVGIQETRLQAARSLTGTSMEPAASRESQGPDQALGRAGIRRLIDRRRLQTYCPCCPYRAYDSDEAG